MWRRRIWVPSTARDDKCTKAIQFSLVAGLGFAVRFALLIPHLGLLFAGGGLGARHAIGQHFGEIFAPFLAAGTSEHCPEISSSPICGDSVATPVEQSQLVLRGDTAIFCRFGKPAGSFTFILGDSLLFITLSVEKA